jgi:hypothetical protein
MSLPELAGRRFAPDEWQSLLCHYSQEIGWVQPWGSAGITLESIARCIAFIAADTVKYMAFDMTAQVLCRSGEEQCKVFLSV